MTDRNLIAGEKEIPNSQDGGFAILRLGPLEIRKLRLWSRVLGYGVETELAGVASLESARRRTPRLESAPGSLPGMLIGIIHAIEKNALTTRASRQRLESWKLEIADS